MSDSKRKIAAIIFVSMLVLIAMGFNWQANHPVTAPAVQHSPATAAPQAQAAAGTIKTAQQVKPATTEQDSGAGTAILILFLLGLYFLPAVIGRQKRNAGAIVALNVLLGWTVIGWIIAFVWALCQDAPAAVALPVTTARANE